MKTKILLGAALVAAVGAVVQWAGEHPLLTGGAVVLAALAVLVVVRRCGKGD